MKKTLIGLALALGLLSSEVFAGSTSLLGVFNQDNVQFCTGAGQAPLSTQCVASFGPSGIIYTTIATVSTGTGTGVQTLATYTLPANALDVPGRRMRIIATFSYAANANNKTSTVNFGSASFTTGALPSNGVVGTIEINVVKRGANAQTVIGAGVVGTTAITGTSTATSIVDTSPIVITATCQNAVSSAGDCVLQDLLVQYYN